MAYNSRFLTLLCMQHFNFPNPFWWRNNHYLFGLRIGQTYRKSHSWNLKLNEPDILQQFLCYLLFYNGPLGHWLSQIKLNGNFETNVAWSRVWIKKNQKFVPILQLQKAIDNIYKRMNKNKEFGRSTLDHLLGFCHSLFCWCAIFWRMLKVTFLRHQLMLTLTTNGFDQNPFSSFWSLSLLETKRAWFIFKFESSSLRSKLSPGFTQVFTSLSFLSD